LKIRANVNKEGKRKGH